jgi:hypothetical protein
MKHRPIVHLPIWELQKAIQVMSNAQLGALLKLLFHHWADHDIPDDDRRIAQLVRCTTHCWRHKYAPMVRPFFVNVSGFLVPNAKHPVIANLRWSGSLSNRQPLSQAKRREIVARDGHTCAYCRRVFGWEELEVDHIVPVARGGNNDDDNLTTACKPCNISKGSKLLSEWRAA